MSAALDDETDQHVPGSPESDEATEYRNPEPPRELHGTGLINADNIGDTVFSKHWLFTTLMQLIQTVERTGERPGADRDVLNIEESLQDELCKLWDMSMNPVFVISTTNQVGCFHLFQEVVKFLQEFKALDIFTGVIAKSRAPRATEICVGILGNMACNAEAAEDMSKNSKLIELLVSLLESPDVPTLVELTRLLHACVAGPDAAPWLRYMETTPTVFSHVSFILQSSTNKDLLLNTAQLLDKLLDVSECLAHAWSTGELVLGCLEACKQVGGESGLEHVDTFLHVLQLASTCQSGVEALLSYSQELMRLCTGFLSHACADDVLRLQGQETSLASALSVITVLLSAWEDRVKFLQEDYELLRCVLKILEEVLPLQNAQRARALRRMRSRSRSTHHDSPPQQTPAPASPHVTPPATPPPGIDSPVIHSSKTDVESVLTRDSVIVTSHTKNITNKAISSHSKSTENAIKDSNAPFSDKHTKFHLIEAIEKSNGRLESESEAVKVDDSESELDADSKKRVQVLFEVIQANITEIIAVLNQMLASSPQPPLGVPECLDYLDTTCPSLRIHYLIHCVQQAALAEESQNKDLVQAFTNIVTSYKLNRVEKILQSLIN